MKQRIREQVAWDWRERWKLLRCSPLKSEAIFGTIAFLWGLHILTFGGNDIIAKAMVSFVPWLWVWGIAGVTIGGLQFYGAYYRVYALRKHSTFANFAFMLFASIALIYSHTFTPGVLICPCYCAWLYEGYKLIQKQGECHDPHRAQ